MLTRPNPEFISWLQNQGFERVGPTEWRRRARRGIDTKIYRVWPHHGGGQAEIVTYHLGGFKEMSRLGSWKLTSELDTFFDTTQPY